MIPLADEDRFSKAIPLVTYSLIAINVLVFLLELSSGNAFILKWAFIPSRFQANPTFFSVTLVSSLFMHAGWLHLGGNMLYLWVFGNNVEDRFGRLPFLLFYLLCGVAATFSQMAFSFGSDIPNLGASGAIAGVLGAYFLMFPWRRVRVLVVRFVTQLPAWIVLGFWFVLQFFNSVGSIAFSSEVGGVAYLAHVGGFVVGLVVAIFLRNTSHWASR
jgi:membrane associated rhomboid family serine protease